MSVVAHLRIWRLLAQEYEKQGLRMPGLVRKQDFEWVRSLLPGDAVSVSLEDTCISGVTHSNSFVGSAMIPKSTCIAHLIVARDGADDCVDLNLDIYTVSRSIREQPDFARLVEQASTSIDDNLISAVDQWVPLILHNPSTGHWVNWSGLSSSLRYALMPAKDDIRDADNANRNRRGP